MNGNYDPVKKGHFFHNTEIRNATTISGDKFQINNLEATHKKINVNSPIVFNKDLNILHQGEIVNLSKVLERLQRLEDFVSTLDKGMVVQQIDNDGNVTIVNYNKNI